MDTVIRNINLYGKPTELGMAEIQEWVNDTSIKLNMMLNGGKNVSEQNNIYGYDTPERPYEPPEEEKPTEEQIKPYDYVIEAGETVYGLAEGSIPTGSICCYRKWYSGTLELWGRRQAGNIKIETDSEWGGYESREGDHTRIIVWGDWPIPFTAIPSVSYRIASTDSATYAGGHEIIESQFGRDGNELVNTKVTSPSFVVRRPLKLTLGHPVITFYAIGKWR